MKLVVNSRVLGGRYYNWANVIDACICRPIELHQAAILYTSIIKHYSGYIVGGGGQEACQPKKNTPSLVGGVGCFSPDLDAPELGGASEAVAELAR